MRNNLLVLISFLFLFIIIIIMAIDSYDDAHFEDLIVGMSTLQQ